MSFSPLMREVVTRRAPAKLNLALSVGPQRASDGYHPIASWFVPIDLYDEMKITRLETDRLSRYAILWHDEAPRTSAIDWSITKDLAARAHMRLEEEIGSKLPVQVKLDKRIPVGSGLGGGSSDAAAMLLGVRELFELDIDDVRLTQIGLELGSDVPYFLSAGSAGSAIVSGMGEQINQAPDIGGAVVLIVPEISCSTGAVYSAYDEQEPGELKRDEVSELAHTAKLQPELLFNDLTPAAFKVAPELGFVHHRATTLLNRPVHMTGSGSTLFVACPGGEFEAESIATRLGGELDGCVVFACRLG